MSVLVRHVSGVKYTIYLGKEEQDKLFTIGSCYQYDAVRALELVVERGLVELYNERREAPKHEAVGG